jgi:uncharacterized protein (DUF2141 family)
MPDRQIGRWSPLTSVVAAVFLLLASEPGAQAAEVVVEFTELRSAAGRLLVAVCPERTFTRRVCAHVGTAPASQGRVVVEDVPPGIYAVQAIHDENGNNEFDRSRIGWPLEGLAFSRDAAMRFGPPAFSDAAVEISPSGRTLTISMRYFE